jgi:enamine deaminase RidA (YjgF/YER057c/UK114 family)
VNKKANPNLSPATRFGNLVFVAGQMGRHPVSGEVGKGVREQTNYALQRIKTILEAAGTSLDNVLTVTTHLTKREDRRPMMMSTASSSRPTSWPGAWWKLC